MIDGSLLQLSSRDFSLGGRVVMQTVVIIYKTSKTIVKYSVQFSIIIAPLFGIKLGNYLDNNPIDGFLLGIIFFHAKNFPRLGICVTIFSQ